MFPPRWNCSISRLTNYADRRPRGEAAWICGDAGDLTSRAAQTAALQAVQQGMMKKRLQKLGPAAAIGIGAGIAAAVLCSLASRGTIPAAVLANLAPLPIMIAMLGYGAIAGAVAVVSATLTVSVLYYVQQKLGESRYRGARRPDFRFLPWVASFSAKSPLGLEPGEGKS